LTPLVNFVKYICLIFLQCCHILKWHSPGVGQGQGHAFYNKKSLEERMKGNELGEGEGNKRSEGERE
jgi:hypothetical protein